MQTAAKPLTVPGLDPRRPHAQAHPRRPATVPVVAHAGAAGQGNPVTDDPLSWLVFAYRVPREHARLRVAVWRRLNAAGAVYLANSVAALPASAAAERSLRRLRKEIADTGGSAQLLRAEAVAGEADVVSGFNATRDNEYAQIIAQCHDLLAEVHSTPAGGFTYAALDQNDRKLAKLADQLAKTRALDSFGASQAGSAFAKLTECRDALDAFARRVYQMQENADATTDSDGARR
jgi:hypothetical protein